jgi:hypothetical protein
MSGHVSGHAEFGASVVLKCDEADCGEELTVPVPSLRIARAEAVIYAGWSFDNLGTDYCFEHG